MVQKRYTLPALAAGALLILAGCGSASTTSGDASPAATAEASPSPSSEQPGQGTTYTSEKYGFSFMYDEPFQEQKDTQWQAESGASSADTVAVFDTSGSQIDRQYRDAFVVNVYELRQEITEDLMPEVKQELEGNVLPQLEQSGDKMTIGPLSPTTVGGLPGFTAEATFDVSGTPMRSNLYFVFNDNLEYQILEQSTAENWDGLQPDFTAMRDSFTVTEPSAGLESGAADPATEESAPMQFDATSSP